MIAGDGSTSLLSVQNLTKSYGGDGFAINRVTFCAKAGEVLGIIGPNGAGGASLRPDRALVEGRQSHALRRLHSDGRTRLNGMRIAAARNLREGERCDESKTDMGS